MRSWILEQLGGETLAEYLRHNQPARDGDPRLDSKLGPMRGKILIERGIDRETFDPATTTWIGGVCSIFTGDGESIRTGEVSFSNLDEFYAWLASWYPRLDQVHDTVGIPPKGCQQVVYVVEDSIFGRRLARWTKLPAEELARALRSIHQEYGAGVIQRWLANYGYTGKVEVVYTSDLEVQLELALGIWEREMGRKVPRPERDQMKIELMYTPVWLSILGLTKGLICEPFHHGTVVEHYHRSNGLAFAGFLPFWTAQGTTRLLTHSQVTNRSNWRDFQTEQGWGGVNHAFNTKDPVGYDPQSIVRRTLQDLATIYGG